MLRLNATITCNQCPETLIIKGYTQEYDVRQAIRLAGWHSLAPGIDLCPECAVGIVCTTCGRPLLEKELNSLGPETDVAWAGRLADDGEWVRELRAILLPDEGDGEKEEVNG